MDATIYRHFRKAPAGDPNASLDWGIARGPEGEWIRIRHGRTGNGTKLTQIPAARFAFGKNAHQEVVERAVRKTAEGYREIGEATADGKGVFKEHRKERNPSAEIHWSASVDMQALDLALGDVAEGLLVAGIACQLCESQLVIGRKDARRWSIGPSAGFGSNGNGGGVVLPAEGPIPVVVLMALKKRFGASVQFADGAGKPVDMTFSSQNPLLAGMKWGVLEEVGEAIGLCHNLRLSTMNQASEGIAF